METRTEWATFLASEKGKLRMEATFTPVTTDEDLKELAQMAGEIWREYWPDIIGAEQTEYMVANFQSLEAITHDVREGGYEYWFICAADDGRKVGYTGGHEERVSAGYEADRFFISKIYLLAEERGRGFASATIRFYDELCTKRGLRTMYLTVNKHNELGIHAYEGKGFMAIDAVETDIGNGFIMDDFIMEKAAK